MADAEAVSRSKLLVNRLREIHEDKSISSNDREEILASLLSAFKGPSVVIERLRLATAEEMFSLASSMRLEGIATTTRRGIIVARVVEELTKAADAVKKRGLQVKCHWCLRLTTNRCQSCGEHGVHHSCLQHFVPVFPDEQLYFCRICARKQAEEIIKGLTNSDLKEMCEQLKLPSDGKRTVLQQRLRDACNYSEHPDVSLLLCAALFILE